MGLSDGYLVLEEPTPSGKAVTASAEDLHAWPSQDWPAASAGAAIRRHRFVTDGASYRQAAARHGVSTSVAWKWSQGFRHIAAKPGGDGRSRLKGARGWLLRRVAATPDLTLGQLQEELRVHGIRVGRMARRRFLKKSIIETGNEQGGWRGGRYAKSLRHCGSDGRCRLAGFRAVGRQGAKATFSAAVIVRCLWRPETAHRSRPQRSVRDDAAAELAQRRVTPATEGMKG